MKYFSSLIFTIFILLISACQADICPADSITYVNEPSQLPMAGTNVPVAPSATPSLVEIHGEMVEIDRIIHGPLCNDTWNGTVYVACDVQIVEWSEEEGPYFFDGCKLNIEPGTVVYVAAHNNEAFYNGCATCHSSNETRK